MERRKIELYDYKDNKKYVIAEDDYNSMIKQSVKCYLGDVKWVLYQYICDMNANDLTIRCGKFAFDKIMRMEATVINVERKFDWHVNGEKVKVFLVNDLDKKQVVISNKTFKDKVAVYKDGKTSMITYNVTDGVAIDATIYPDDIVLYFA